MVLSLEDQKKKSLILAELNKLYNARDERSLARKKELQNALLQLTGPLTGGSAKKAFEEAEQKRRILREKWERERKLRHQ